jgi:hypothetical protein
VYVQRIKALQASCDRLKQENSSLVKTLGQRKVAMDDLEVNSREQNEIVELTYREEMDTVHEKYRDSVGRNKALSKEAKFLRKQLERAEQDVLEEKQKVAAEKSRYEQLKQDAAFEVRVGPEDRVSERQKKEKENLAHELRVTKRALVQAKESLRAQRLAPAADTATDPRKKQQQVQQQAQERTWAKAEQRLVLHYESKLDTEQRAHNESQIILEKYAVENEQLHQQMHLLEAALDNPTSDITVVQAESVKLRKQNALLRGRLTELDARSSMHEQQAAKHEVQVRRMKKMLSQDTHTAGGLHAQKPPSKPPGSRTGSRTGRGFKLSNASAKMSSGGMTKVAELQREKKQLQQQLSQQRQMLVDAHDETEELRVVLASNIATAKGAPIVPMPVPLRSTTTLEQENLDLQKQNKGLTKRVEAYRKHSRKSRMGQSTNSTLITGGFKFNTHYYNLQLRRHGTRAGFEIGTYNPETMQSQTMFVKIQEAAAVLGCRDEVLQQDPVEVALLQSLVGMVGMRTLPGGEEELHLMVSHNNATAEMHEKTAMMQAIARGRSDRKALEEKQVAATKMAAVFRGHQERDELETKTTAAVKLQALYRGTSMREFDYTKSDSLDQEMTKARRQSPLVGDQTEWRFGTQIASGEYLSMTVKEKNRSALTGAFELELEAYDPEECEAYRLSVPSKELELLLGIDAVAKISRAPVQIFANADHNDNDEHMGHLKARLIEAIQLVDRSASEKVLQLVLPPTAEQ